MSNKYSITYTYTKITRDEATLSSKREKPKVALSQTIQSNSLPEASAIFVSNHNRFLDNETMEDLQKLDLREKLEHMERPLTHAIRNIDRPDVYLWTEMILEIEIKKIY